MKKEIVISFIFTIFINVLNFFQNKFFVKYMGMDILGMMKLFSQILAYLNIVELGLGTASAVALYKPLAEKNYKKVSIIVNTMENIYNKIALIIFLSGILVMPFLQFFIDESYLNIKVYFYWGLYIFQTIITYLYIKYVILFTANQEYLFVKIIQSCSKILIQILQIIILVKLKSFFIYIFLFVLDSLIQYILFKKHYNKEYNYITKTKEKYNEIKNNVKNLFWHKIGSLVVFNTDLILISKFVSLEVVGIYASYQMVISIVNTAMGIIIGVILPKIGKYVATTSKEEVYNLFKKISCLFIFSAIFFTFNIYFLINPFIKLWIGMEFIFEKEIIVLILINFFIGVIRKPIDIFKDTIGYFEDIQSPIYEAIINFVISIILGMKLGLKGIIIGTIASNITIIMIYKPILVFKNCFKKNLREYLFFYTKYTFLTLISFNILYIIVKLFIKENTINTWKEWIIIAIIISIVSLITIFIIFLLNHEFRDIIKDLFKIKKKKYY